jgi:hypothetical protein
MGQPFAIVTPEDHLGGAMATQTVYLLKTIDARPATIRKALESADIQIISFLEISKEEVRGETDRGAIPMTVDPEVIKPASAVDPSTGPSSP